MEEQKKNSLVFLLIIFIVVSLVLGGYIIYDKLLSNKTSENEIVDKTNNTYNEEQILALGLVRYKYANEIEHIFQATNDKEVTNYNVVAENFTNDFINNASNICWPTKKENSYYLNDNCSAGGTTKYTYKSIKIKEYNVNKITYTITIDEVSTTLESDNNFKENHNEVQQDFEIVLENNIWKINKFTYNSMALEFN